MRMSRYKFVLRIYLALRNLGPEDQDSLGEDNFTNRFGDHVTNNSGFGYPVSL
jgi:hypothetical protein